MFLLFHSLIMPRKYLRFIHKITPGFIQFSVFLLFILAALYITYPLIFHLTSYVTGKGDELLIAWIHGWVIHSIDTNIFRVFEANIFYPYLHPLAYSDLFITSSLLSYFPVKILHEPIVANNVTLIFSLFSLGYCTYLLSFYVTRQTLPSILSGILVMFSPAVLDKSIHIQVLFIFFVPLSILFLLVFVNTKKIHFFYLWCICFVFQTYNSFLPGYFIVIASGVLFGYLYFVNKKKLFGLGLKKMLFASFISVLCIIPIVIPYYQVSQTYHFTRDIREAIHLSLQPEDFLFAYQFTYFAPFLYKTLSFLHNSKIELKTGYLGFVFSLLFLSSIFFCVTSWKKNHKFFFIAISGLLLSFGPFLHIGRKTIHYPFPIPLPYALFYAFAPGFRGFRNAARWEMLFIIFIAVFIAYMITIVGKKNIKMQSLITIILLILVVAEFPFPMRFESAIQRKDFPPVYSWLNTLSDSSVIIELPAYVWYMHPYAMEELTRVYYSTENFHPTVNGASGYSPVPWEENIKQLMIEFPYAPSFTRMKKLGVTYIVFHKKEYDVLHMNNFVIDTKRIDDGNTLLDQLKSTNDVTLIKEFSDDYVFKVNYD
jgi:hypothetical protein